MSGSWSSPQVPESLVQLARGCAGAADAQPAFPWRPDRWRAWLGSLDDLPDGTVREGVMSRAEPTRLALDAAAGRAPIRAFFMSAMIWGFGDLGYGPWRTARMLATPNAEDKIGRVLQLARDEGSLAAYEAISGPCRLDRMGPVFATKLVYFSGRRSGAGGPHPLVLDRMIGTLLAEHGVVLRWGRFDREDYGRYLHLMNLVADRVHATPDDVECALFSIASGTAG